MTAPCEKVTDPADGKVFVMFDFGDAVGVVDPAALLVGVCDLGDKGGIGGKAEEARQAQVVGGELGDERVDCRIRGDRFLLEAIALWGPQVPRSTISRTTLW